MAKDLGSASSYNCLLLLSFFFKKKKKYLTRAVVVQNATLLSQDRHRSPSHLLRYTNTFSDPSGAERHTVCRSRGTRRPIRLVSDGTVREQISGRLHGADGRGV